MYNNTNVDFKIYLFSPECSKQPVYRYLAIFPKICDYFNLEKRGRTEIHVPSELKNPALIIERQELKHQKISYIYYLYILPQKEKNVNLEGIDLGITLMMENMIAGKNPRAKVTEILNYVIRFGKWPNLKERGRE